MNASCISRSGPKRRYLKPASHGGGQPAPKLLRAYQATRYEAGSVVAHIGQRSAEVDEVLRRWGVRQAAFVGGGNPRSRRMPDGWNRRRHALLCTRLRGLPFMTGTGRGRGWCELHVLAALPLRPAAALGTKFGQSAIVVVTRGCPARLVLL